MRKMVMLVTLFALFGGFAFAQDKDTDEKVLKKLEKIIQLQKETHEELAKLSDELDDLSQRLDKIEKQLKQQPRIMPMPPRVDRKSAPEGEDDNGNIERIKELQAAQKRFDEAFKLHEEKKYEDAIKIFKEIYEKHPKESLGSTSAYNIACGYSLLNKKDEALDWLEKSIESGFAKFDHMENDTDLDNIRDDKRYKKLLEKAAEKGEESEEAY